MSRPWIKICGLRDRASVSAAADAGADAVGFVFASSPRRIDVETACELKVLLPAGVSIVAVMQHPEPEAAGKLLETLRPDFLQTDSEDFEFLALPSGCRPLPVFRRAADVPKSAGRFLFEGPVSGAGALSDWQAAAELVHCGDLVLAGGLNPENVSKALRAVSPFGVDVSSGVESSPGRKDPARIAAFVRAARSTEYDDRRGVSA